MSETGYLNVAEIFGENVFNDAVMQERLPKKVYKKLKEVTKKSYTDKSIKKKKKYSYKVRMFYVNEDGKREYSPYSNGITIKVK